MSGLGDYIPRREWGWRPRIEQERDHYAKQPCNCKKIDALVEAAKRAVKEAGRYSPDGLPRSPVMVDLLEAVAALETTKDAP